MEELLIQAARGAVSGAAYGLGSWAKNIDDSKKRDFDVYKFIRAPIMGAIVGAVAGYTGLSTGEATDYLALAGYTAIADIGIKALARKYGGKVLNLLRD